MRWQDWIHWVNQRRRKEYCDELRGYSKRKNLLLELDRNQIFSFSAPTIYLSESLSSSSCKGSMRKEIGIFFTSQIQRRKERMKEDTDLRTDEASSRDNANCTLSNLLNDDERLSKTNVSVLMILKKLSKKNVSERKPPPPSTSYFSNLWIVKSIIKTSFVGIWN